MAPSTLTTPRRRPKPSIYLVVAVAALLAGLVPREAAALYGNTSFLWPGAPVMIPVCWENPTPANAVARNWVQDAVERNWARHARVNFTGWGKCTKGAPGLHILHSTNSRAPGGYPGLNGVDNGMELPLSRPQGDVRALALHEFGHALGFYHEEERPDYTPSVPTPAACKKQSYPNSNPQYYGAYDIDSVMSYCGQPASDTSTWKQSLSSGDIAAVQTAYGRRIPGTLLSTRARSLSANAFVPGLTGARPFLWSADEYTDDQEWRRYQNFTTGLLPVPKQAFFIYPSGAPGRAACLHMVGDRADVEIRDCITVAEEAAPQRWNFGAIEIRGYGGKCLDLPDGDTTEGTPVQMWECLGNENQKWSISPAGEIKFGNLLSDHCLTAPGGAFADGTPLQIARCGLPAGQRFFFRSPGTIRYAGQCVDVQAALTSDYMAGRTLPYDGAPVQLWTCLDEQLNQKWNFSGPVRAMGKCLGRPYGIDADGVVPWTRSCNGTDAQTWDYYFK